MVDTPTNHLVAWRKWARLTGEQLGEKCRADKTAISRLERGRARLTHEWRERIAAALSEATGRPVSPQDLLRAPAHSRYDDESKDSLTNVSEVAGPQRDNTEDGAVKERVLRPIVQTLVQQFGLKAVMREVASVEEDEAEAGERPTHRRRTS